MSAGNYDTLVYRLAQMVERTMIKRNPVVPWLLSATLALPLLGCGSDQQAQAKKSPEVVAAEIMQAETSPYSPGQVAAAFALNSEFTDLQRDLLNKELVGSVVEWSIRVYEISKEDKEYKITSQPLPVQDEQAIPLLRAIAFPHPKNDADVEQLLKTKTNDVIRVRGRVRDIMLRTVVIIDPAILVQP